MKLEGFFRNAGGALLFMGLVIGGIGHAVACTLWAAAGDDAGGGTLVAKNRDWRPDHRQELRLVRSAEDFSYLGLFAVGGDEPGLKAGVNEEGLSVVSASVSSLSRGRIDESAGQRAVLRRLLASYADTGEVLDDAEALFSTARPDFVMIADRRRVLMVEVGLDGLYAIEATEQGAVTHTNHYLRPELAALQDRIPRSSAIRLRRVQELLSKGGRPLDLDGFTAISRDRNDGPDDSLWRSGRTRTLASWILRTPSKGPPILRIVLADPDEPAIERRLTLDAGFWKSGRF